jgi:hypothetical protein
MTWRLIPGALSRNRHQSYGLLVTVVQRAEREANKTQYVPLTELLPAAIKAFELDPSVFDQDDGVLPIGLLVNPGGAGRNGHNAKFERSQDPPIMEDESLVARGVHTKLRRSVCRHLIGFDGDR